MLVLGAFAHAFWCLRENGIPFLLLATRPSAFLGTELKAAPGGSEK